MSADSRWRAFKVLLYERIRPVWLDVRPMLLAALMIATVTLGTVGFQRYEALHHDPRTVLNSFYWSLTLFELHANDLEPPIPWTVEVARFMAPLLIGYAVFRGLVAIFRGQLELFGIRLVRNHVVVAGLGNAGFRLATAFRAKGYRVVVVELDENNGSIAGCKERGINVLVGDARDRRMLSKARVGHARYLIVVCGDDGRNVEVEVAAESLTNERRRGVLHAFVHLLDAGLWRMLKAESIARQVHGATRVEFFNVFDAGARMLLDERPPFELMSSRPRRPHVLIVGIEGIGDALVVGIGRMWQTSEPLPGEDLRLTIVDEQAEERRARLLARYPSLEDICSVHAVSSTLGVELQRGRLGIDVEPEHPVSAVYICVSKEAKALEVALALRARPEMHVVPFAVAVSDARAGLATMLHDDPQTAEGVYGFGIFDRTLQVLPLLRGTTELLARAKHEEYLRHELGRGTRMGEGVMVPWDELDEQYKEANRAFADGVGAKLEAAGCVLVPAPLIDPAGALFEFSDAQVEELARLEHERWMSERRRNGWRYGQERDDARRLHPLILKWEDLPERERDKDRDPVREIPVMLARSGFEILRRGSSSPAGRVDRSAPGAEVGVAAASR